MKALADWLENTGTTRREFAKSIGVTETSISYYLNRRHTPRPKYLRAISEKTGLSIDDLLEIEQKN